MDMHPLIVWRRRNGLVGYQFAARVGIDPSHLSKIERYRNDPTLRMTKRLIDATGGELRFEDFLNTKETYNGPQGISQNEDAESTEGKEADAREAGGGPKQSH